MENKPVKNFRVNKNVHHPAHYTQGGIECIDAMKAATVNKCPFEAILTGNVIKYLWRYEAKGGAEDIEKALWYLTRLHKEVVDRLYSYKLVETEKGVGLFSPWKTCIIPKEGDEFNPNEELRKGLLTSLIQTGGYCPCQPNRSRDTMCPCRAYRDNGKCICGMFVTPKKEDDVEKETNIIEVVKDNVETESGGVDTKAEDSKE